MFDSLLAAAIIIICSIGRADAGFPFCAANRAQVTARSAITLEHVADSNARLSIDPTGKGDGYKVIQDDDGQTYEFRDVGGDSFAGLWVTDSGTASWNGSYTFNGTDKYSNLNNSSRIQFTLAKWLASPDYTGNTNGLDYAWQETSWSALLGDPPSPTVARNPLASETNWTVLP